MEHIQELLSEARQHVHNTLDVSDETVRRLHARVMRALPKEQKAPKKWIPATLAVTAVAAAAAMVMPRVIDNMQAVTEQGGGGAQTPGPVTKFNTTAETDLRKVPDSAIQKMSDNEKLTLINQIPWGSSYEAVKQQVPELGEQKPEGGDDYLGQQGLTEAFVPITVFDKQIQLEVNFRKNHMYAIYYEMQTSDAREAEIMQQKVVDFYNGKFNPSKQQKDAEGGTTRVTNDWDAGMYTVGVTNLLNYDGTSILRWGYGLKESEQQKWAGDNNVPSANMNDAVLVGVKIGDTPEQVRSALGTDYKEEASDGLYAQTIWKYPGIEVSFMKDGGHPLHNKVMSVTVNKPGYKTSLDATLGDKAQTVLEKYRSKYKEHVSVHSNKAITGWFEVGQGVLLIFDFDASDGLQPNGNVTSESKVVSIRLASTQAFD